MNAGRQSPAPVQETRSSRHPGLAWNWSDVALGACYALPGAIVVLSDPPRGFALAIGVLPAAIVGLPPTRRARLAIAALGMLIGVPMLLGGLLASVPVIAVVTIAMLGVTTALLAVRSRIGLVTMTLSLPMVGVGLSYSDLEKAAGLAGLMVAGSVFACLVAMLWPEDEGQPSSPANATVTPTLSYGLRLGAAGASAAAIGFLLGLEHVGWACAAALLVMRPAPEMQRLRSIGRILAVAVGAAAAMGLLELSPSAGWYAFATVAAIAGVAGTRRSRWYVTAAFTTFLVFLMLLYSNPHDAGARFTERLLETLLGVGLAYAFGLGLPALVGRRDATAK